MRVIALTIIVASVLVACGGGGEPNVAKRQATPLDLSTTGTIRGEVTFSGPPPAMRELPVKNYPGCTPEGTDPVLSGDAMIKDGRVQNVFVYVKSGLGDRVFAIPKAPVEIDQKGCIYVPRVIGAQVGQPVLYKNSDAVMHNVHGTPASAKAWNVSLGGKGMSKSIQLDQADVMIPVRCDVHPWMQSYVGVVDHPYFAVTSADGRFELKQVPPGDYIVGLWHEKFGVREAKTTVTQQVATTVNFSLSATPSN